ncbi:glycogenin-2-like isoform X4 [Trichoplusia ni]|uniref:glycogenin glucosyltransferase n=1 Tax=Trichoplusia ni TaxID=7111 RepID=A0A7E5VV30_TRINI|nr:glycogenin-2-like isoform X4 [Trichoplusia ni]
MSNRAWVTLATNDSYGLGALVLAHSLRRVGSSYPAVVLITPAVTEPMRDRLRAVFAEVIIVDVLDSGDAAHLALLQRPELGITFTKIHCWNLTQYDKCVFLDADTLVVQNSDELFDREQLSAAPDVGWPDCFNSGVFVFAPSADTFAQLITFAQERGSFDGGDQGLLNSFFSDWAHGDINKHLPFIYNVTSAAFYSYLPALKHFGQNLKIIHFIGAAKPWLQQFNFESGSVDAPDHIRGLLQLWWDIFVGHVHSQLDTGMSGVAGNLARVQPGGAGPREALDELTRRQGWEAGNIDYMGADSFDNIWAKISQTLSQPRTSPPKQSPPKELAPQQAPEQVVVQSAEVVQEPIAEKVEVAKEAVPVESAAPVEAAPASVAVAPAPVQAEAPVAPAEVAEVPVPVEAAVLVEARVADVEPAATDVPVSVEAVVVDAAPIEAAPVVPVTVEAIVPDVPATVEALPAVEDAAPAKEPVKAEAPKAAVVEEPAQKTESPVVSAAAPSAADSPPLATTPSKEEAPAVPAAKTEERRKPAGKLKLSPPAAADPLPTPDSELEDAAALASDIIARELRAVAAPTVSAAEPAPAASPPAALEPRALHVAQPEVPTPPVGALSLAQIGVKAPAKGKATTAALIESSVTDTAQPTTPASSSTPTSPEPAAPGAPAEAATPAQSATAAAPAEATVPSEHPTPAEPSVPAELPKPATPAAPASDPPKKKVVKKVVKKDASGADAPVPPPRKKEKKPKEK